MTDWDMGLLGNRQIEWRFPGNGGGKIDGFNDAGIETFMDRRVESLTRETIQNSLDAWDPTADRPVEVHFTYLDLPVAAFPLLGQFNTILLDCQRLSHSIPKAKDFFAHAIELVGKQTIPFLVIRDYNTTGLGGADQEIDSDWADLIKCVGVSQKPSGAGGSFGIGKNAPYSCSALRTVFYGTMDTTGKRAFQGKAILVSHTISISGERTQGTGYFGCEGNTPIRNGNIDAVPGCFDRTTAGTDLFVAGFEARQDWQQRIIKAVIDHFFVAIDMGRLVVRGQNTVIDNNTIARHLVERSRANPKDLSAHYYEAMKSESRSYFREEDFMGLGEVELHLIQGKDCPKKIAMVRGTGMKIFDKGGYHTPIRYAGVFLAKGDGISEMLRACENPSHSDWVAERHEPSSKLLDAIYRWIRENLSSMAMPTQAEEADVEGMSQYLPDFMDSTDTVRETGRNYSERNEPAEIDLRTLTPNSTRKRQADDVIEDINAGEASGDAGDGDGSGDPAPSGHPGGNGGPGRPRGEEGDTGDGNGDGEGNDRHQSAGPGNPSPTRTTRLLKPVSMKSQRFWCKDRIDNRYRITLSPMVDVADGIIALTVCGDGEDEKAPIDQAILVGTDESLRIPAEGRIAVQGLQAQQQVAIDVQLGCSELCAVEVALYEYKTA